MLLTFSDSINNVEKKPNEMITFITPAGISSQILFSTRLDCSPSGCVALDPPSLYTIAETKEASFKTKQSRGCHCSLFSLLFSFHFVIKINPLNGINFLVFPAFFKISFCSELFLAFRKRNSL